MKKITIFLIFCLVLGSMVFLAAACKTENNPETAANNTAGQNSTEDITTTLDLEFSSMMRELDDKGKYYKNLQRINDEKAIVALSKFYGQKFELRIDPDRYYRDYDEEDLKVIKLMVEAMISDKLDYTTEWKPMILYVVNREDASNKVVEDPYLADEIKQKFDGFLEKDPGLSHEVEIAIDYGYFGEWPIKE